MLVCATSDREKPYNRSCLLPSSSRRPFMSASTPILSPFEGNFAKNALEARQRISDDPARAVTLLRERYRVALESGKGFHHPDADIFLQTFEDKNYYERADLNYLRKLIETGLISFLCHSLVDTAVLQHPEFLFSASPMYLSAIVLLRLTSALYTKGVPTNILLRASKEFSTEPWSGLWDLRALLKEGYFIIDDERTGFVNLIASLIMQGDAFRTYCAIDARYTGAHEPGGYQILKPQRFTAIIAEGLRVCASRSSPTSGVLGTLLAPQANANLDLAKNLNWLNQVLANHPPHSAPRSIMQQFQQSSFPPVSWFAHLEMLRALQYNNPEQSLVTILHSLVGHWRKWGTAVKFDESTARREFERLRSRFCSWLECSNSSEPVSEPLLSTSGGTSS
ncbi:hypothetical protein PENSPDRAFT_688467 [Peniophora sp. CONT]|nr:hypothetical protein PENSPDRAFT_688467 [Peniophora sp. CONT]